MKHTPISQIRPTANFESIYLLAQAEIKSKRNGETYATLVFQDSTGTLQGVMWEGFVPILNKSVKAEDFVLASGEISLYNNAPQFVVRKIQAFPEKDVDLHLFIPHTPQNLGELERELDGWIDSMAPGDLRRLMLHLLGPGGLAREEFLTAPAAVTVHQAYVGGLLEHSLAVARLAMSIAEFYKPFDRDLLLAGAILHDLGKIGEYEWKRVIRYSSRGRLIGHISITVEWLSRCFRDLAPFDELLASHVTHLILAHHGKREWGSPVLPKTREALLLHYADFIDAFMAAFATETGKARLQGQEWTPFCKLFETYLYAGPVRADAARAGAPGFPGLPGGQAPGLSAPDDPRWKDFFAPSGDAVDDPGR